MKRTTIIPMVGMALYAIVAVSCSRGESTSAPQSYKTQTIALAQRSLSSDYSARISSSHSVEIRPQISGMITEVRIREGAAVRRGQTLFVLDQTPYKAALHTAQANVASARAQVATAQLTADSKKELFQAKVVSTFDLQAAENALQVARATLAQCESQEVLARNNLSYTVIQSPVDGVAGMTSFREGALVSSAMAAPLVELSSDRQMHVYFSMTEKQILSLSHRDGHWSRIVEAMPEVELRMSNGSLYDHKGKIDAVSGVIDASTGGISIRAVFPNDKGVLRSGGVGTIVFPYTKDSCLVVPQAATYEIQDKIFVYKVVDGKAVSTAVKVFPIHDGKEYIVESGLQVGDVIIAEGAGLVKEGSVVVSTH